MKNLADLILEECDFTTQPCPLCQGEQFERLASYDRNLLGITTVGCACCGLLQTNPRPSASGLQRFYRVHYRVFYQDAKQPDQAYIADLKKDSRLAYTANFLANEMCLSLDAVVLDYGCGEGSLFAALRTAGFVGNFYGVELNASFGEYASRYGNAVVSSSISARELVDVAIVNHVLEHLNNPIGILKEIAKCIKPGGFVYIDVPDAEEYKTIYDLHIAHISHFSVKTLSALVQRAGFVVQAVEKHSPPHHPRSIRLVAKPDSSVRAAPLPSPQGEFKAWSAVRAAGRFRNTIRLRLRRVGWLRGIYLAFKRAYS